MENQLVEIVNDEPLISSLAIAEGFGRRHDQVVRLIQKHKNIFNELGQDLTKHIYGKGRPFIDHLLNETQTMFLGSIMKSSKTGIEFKKQLAMAFSSTKQTLFKIKKALAELDVDGVDVRYVYAAQDSKGNIKIGISNNPERRLIEINRHNPENLKLVYIKEATKPYYRNETLTHKAAGKHHIKGEWFGRKALDEIKD